MDNNGNNKSLYKPSFEHDACGIGAVVSIDNKASHKIVEDALLIVEKLEHRAGKDFAGEIGDGVGIMLHVSHKFFKKTGKKLGIDLGGEGDYGVGMFFFPRNALLRKQAQKMFEVICKKENVEFLAWKEAEVDASVLAENAKKICRILRSAL